MADLSTAAAQPAEDGSGDSPRHSNPTPGSPEMAMAVAGAEEEIKPNDFILDSKATVHATSEKRLLLGSRDLRPGDAASLTRRDGETLWAIMVGLVQLGTSFYLAEVHYFPGLPPASTLVSVHQLTRRGFSVMFCGADCFVQDRSTGAVVGKGQLRDEDGFYHLDYLRIPSLD